MATVVSSLVHVVFGELLLVTSCCLLQDYAYLVIIVKGISIPLGWIIQRCFLVCRTDDEYKLVVLTTANNQV